MFVAMVAAAVIAVKATRLPMIAASMATENTRTTIAALTGVFAFEKLGNPLGTGEHAVSRNGVGDPLSAHEADRGTEDTIEPAEDEDRNCALLSDDLQTVFCPYSRIICAD